MVMLKKYTAVILLSFASMVLLAFAVFPHHHHQDYICFNDIHCEQESPETQSSHGHDPCRNSGDCVKYLFQTHISRSQTLAHTCAEGHCHHFILSPFLPSDLLAVLSLEAEIKIIPLFAYYKEKLHSSRLVFDLAGRAPPVLI